MRRSHEEISYPLNEINYEPRSLDEGSCYLEYDNPVRENGIKHIGRPERHRYVTYHNHEVTMENGARYNVITTEIPEQFQKDSSDIPNIETTAWLTQPDGINKRRMAELAKLAMPSVFVSVQQNRDRIGHIDRNAHNEIEIAKTMGEIYDFDTEHAITNGISRGAMTALIVSSIAKQHNMEIPYTDAIVPCFPYGLNIKRDLVEYLKLLPNETNSLRAIKDIPFKYLRHYPSTLDTNLWQQVKEIPTLLGGEVGSQIKRNMDDETFGYVTVYKGDVMSQGRRWQKLLNSEDYPNIVMNALDGGGHLSCIGNDCYEDWYGRIRTVSELLHEDPNNRFIGGTALRALATERNPVFLQPNESQLIRDISA